MHIVPASSTLPLRNCGRWRWLEVETTGHKATEMARWARTFRWWKKGKRKKRKDGRSKKGRRRFVPCEAFCEGNAEALEERTEKSEECRPTLFLFFFVVLSFFFARRSIAYVKSAYEKEGTKKDGKKRKRKEGCEWLGGNHSQQDLHLWRSS